MSAAVLKEIMVHRRTYLAGYIRSMKTYHTINKVKCASNINFLIGVSIVSPFSFLFIDHAYGGTIPCTAYIFPFITAIGSVHEIHKEHTFIEYIKKLEEYENDIQKLSDEGLEQMFPTNSKLAYRHECMRME